MTPFGITGPGRILFGRGEATKAPALIAGFGARGIVVHGSSITRAEGLLAGLIGQGCAVLTIACEAEPTLAMLENALAQVQGFNADWVVGFGGGAVLDMAKALAALIPAPGPAMDHLEVVGRGLPLLAPPLPFIAIPTTSGTGAEATKNAVIGVPEHQRKVSLRDDRMLARIAIVDPALTDHCPRGVTLASGLDAITQVIEPYVSCKATPFTDALTLPAIGKGLSALMRLMQGEDAEARDQMAWVSLCGGLALANAGLGAVHGLAGVLGGTTGAAHGVICGALLAPVLQVNLKAASVGSDAEQRLKIVFNIISGALNCPPDQAAIALAEWAFAAGLPRLSSFGLRPEDFGETAQAALITSSMKGNPVPLGVDELQWILAQAG